MVPEPIVRPFKPDGHEILWLLWPGKAHLAQEEIMGVVKLVPTLPREDQALFFSFVYCTSFVHFLIFDVDVVLGGTMRGKESFLPLK